MEKKTIGKFIAVLRKASGMTQKELGDRLYVSDKTVSRWERDECTPELALIPVIAEIFGVTTDELLRGERNALGGEGSAFEISAEAEAYQKKKSDKQWRSLLHRRMTTYQNLTYLSVGLPIVGLLGAAIANLALTRGLVGFCIAVVFVLASVICQLCFAANAKMPMDDEEDAESSRISDLVAFNDRVTVTAVKVMFFDLSTLAFCMPIMRYSHFGLTFGSWVLEGTVCVLLALVIGWAVYAFAVRPLLIKNGSLSPDSEDMITRRRAWYKTLRKHVIVGVIIAVVLGILSAVVIELPPKLFVKPEAFEDWVKFQKYMDEEWQKYQLEEEMHEHEDGFRIDVEIEEIETKIDVEILPGQAPNDDIYADGGDYVEVPDKDGNILFAYAHVPGFVVDFSFGTSDDGLPIKVYHGHALHDVYSVLEGISTALLMLIAADALVTVLLLVKKRKKIFAA